MDKKNLRKTIFSSVSKGLVGMTLLGLASCGPINANIIDKDKEPVKVEYTLTGEVYFHVLNKDGKKTGVYLEEGFYQNISANKKKGELVEIPNHKDLYVKSGQGKLDGFLTNLGSGGGYMPAYSKGKPLEGFYVSEGTIRESCYKNTGEQFYDGRLENIPRTNLEVRCVLFDGVSPANNLGGGGDGGSGGSGGGGAGGGGGSSGGDSGGGR